MTLAICLCAQRFGEGAKLISRPDGDRRLHERDTPLVGGIAILLPVCIVSIFYLISQPHNFVTLTAVVSSMLMLGIGILDDRLGISPVWRLLALTFISFGIFSFQPIFVLHSLRLWFLHQNYTVQLDPFATVATAVMIIGFVNAANMADGINGQLLGSVIIWSGFILLHSVGVSAMPYIALICSSCVGLYFNLRGKLFAGSAGSYAASFFVALGAIATYRQAVPPMYAQTPMFWFWLPVADCLRMIVTRVVQGKRPFAGDRNHFHHLLLDFLRVRYSLLIYLFLLGLPGACAEIDQHWGKVALLFCLAIYGCAVFWCTDMRVRRRREHGKIVAGCGRVRRLHIAEQLDRRGTAKLSDDWYKLRLRGGRKGPVRRTAGSAEAQDDPSCCRAKPRCRLSPWNRHAAVRAGQVEAGIRAARHCRRAGGALVVDEPASSLSPAPPARARGRGIWRSRPRHAAPFWITNVGSDPAEEMMAISEWSYAAALHIGIDPGIVFHAGAKSADRDIAWASDWLLRDVQPRKLPGAAPDRAAMVRHGLRPEARPCGSRAAPQFPQMRRWLRWRKRRSPRHRHAPNRIAAAIESLRLFPRRRKVPGRRRSRGR